MQSACFLVNNLTPPPSQHGDVGIGPVRSQPELRHPGEEWVLVAGKPKPDLLALEVGRTADAAVSPGGQLQPGLLKYLRDGDDPCAFVSGRSGRRLPTGRHIRLA